MENYSIILYNLNKIDYYSSALYNTLDKIRELNKLK